MPRAARLEVPGLPLHVTHRGVNRGAVFIDETDRATYLRLRTGTLWESRFKSCLVDSDRYLLSVIRYIEPNPVRARMVADPADYVWSSVHVHLARRIDRRITEHESFLALGATRHARRELCQLAEGKR